jgi:hypothetical protein
LVKGRKEGDEFSNNKQLIMKDLIVTRSDTRYHYFTFFSPFTSSESAFHAIYLRFYPAGSVLTGNGKK